MTNSGGGYPASRRKARLCASITGGSIRFMADDFRRRMMNEFLSGFGGGPVWAAFVLGVVASTALALTAFWGGVGRLARRWTGRRRPDGAGR